MESTSASAFEHLSDEALAGLASHLARWIESDHLGESARWTAELGDIDRERDRRAVERAAVPTPPSEA